MRMRKKILAAGFALLIACGPAAPGAESVKPLLGAWNGRAAGPKGGPPTGDITVQFIKDGAGAKGTIAVKGAGGGEYSGQVSEVRLQGGIFSALALFKFGESTLEVRVTGPMKGRSIDGTFSVVSKGQKMGDGTFSITKGPVSKPKKK